MIDLLGLPPTRSAVISPCGKYRYRLYRRLAADGLAVTFLMPNPSTANHELDDPTIRKVSGFCRRCGFSELHVVNLFALRPTDPRQLGKTLNPVGPENRRWIEHAAGLSDRVVCAWSTYGGYMRQDEAVLGWVAGRCQPMCLGLMKGRHPRYPLYVPYAAELAPFICV
jgi:hypothetical protein